MPKTVNGIEYLSYSEVASEYGYSRSSIPTMVTHGAFKKTKFPHDSKAYVSRNEIEAYKNRKNKSANEISTQVEEREVPQGVPFLVQSNSMALMELIRLYQQIESNRQQVENSRQQDQTFIKQLMATLQPV